MELFIIVLGDYRLAVPAEFTALILEINKPPPLLIHPQMGC